MAGPRSPSGCSRRAELHLKSDLNIAAVLLGLGGPDRLLRDMIEGRPASRFHATPPTEPTFRTPIAWAGGTRTNALPFDHVRAELTEAYRRARAAADNPNTMHSAGCSLCRCTITPKAGTLAAPGGWFTPGDVLGRPTAAVYCGPCWPTARDGIALGATPAEVLGWALTDRLGMAVPVVELGLPLTGPPTPGRFGWLDLDGIVAFLGARRAAAEAKPVLPRFGR